MTIAALADVDLSAWDEPDPGQEPRALLESWLRYQRHEFVRKLRDLTAEQLAAFSVPPVELSVLGLLRHMTQMEHVYLAWGLGGGERALRYGEDDFAGGTVETVEDDLGVVLRRGRAGRGRGGRHAVARGRRGRVTAGRSGPR